MNFIPKGNPKKVKGFRFNGRLYEDFKILAKEDGYGVTEVFEKFVSLLLEHGLSLFRQRLKLKMLRLKLVFMLAWLKEGRYWVNLGGEKILCPGSSFAAFV